MRLAVADQTPAALLPPQAQNPHRQALSDEPHESRFGYQNREIWITLHTQVVHSQLPLNSLYYTRFGYQQEILGGAVCESPKQDTPGGFRKIGFVINISACLSGRPAGIPSAILFMLSILSKNP